MNRIEKNEIIWWLTIGLLVIVVSILHYTTPTMKWQYHLIFMQSYFIPILLGAFQFGVKGGLGTAVVISLIYFPHIMLQWGGLVEGNLMRFMQILLFNVIGYLTGLKAQREREEKEQHRQAAIALGDTLQRLKEQSAKLDELEEQLRQSDRLAVIGELTAGLAHELRNPLGSIRGVVDILKDELSESEKKNEFFAILVQETGRISEVLENYLGFARKSRRQKRRFDAREMIRNVELLFASRARKETVELSVKTGDLPLIMEVDPTEFQHVLVNLVLNAIQAAPAGGKVGMEATAICTEKSKPGGFEGESVIKTNGIELTVSDNGPGIAEQDADRIFQPFFTTKSGGTGLGLAIVKRITEQNHWKLELESRHDLGTCFRLFIPAANPDTTEKT